jgi:hypothetical protein
MWLRILVLVAGCGWTCAGTALEDLRLWPAKLNGKYGYLTTANRWHLEPQYDRAAPFEGDFAIVGIEDKTGLIDRQGKYIIGPIAGALSPPREGLLHWRTPEGDGFLDYQGRLVIPAIPGRTTSDFSEGLAVAKSAERCGYLDPRGTLVIPAEFEWISFFQGGLAAARKPKGQTGFINRRGEWAIPPRFEAASAFAGQRAAVKLKGMWGFVNTLGVLVIEPQYDTARDFNAGRAAVCSAEKWFYIDSAGRRVSPLCYSLGNYAEERAQFVRLGDPQYLTGYLTLEGEMAIPPRFHYAEDFHAGAAYVEQDGKAGYIDRNGAVLIPFQYEPRPKL